MKSKLRCWIAHLAPCVQAGRLTAAVNQSLSLGLVKSKARTAPAKIWRRYGTCGKSGPLCRDLRTPARCVHEIQLALDTTNTASTTKQQNAPAPSASLSGENRSTESIHWMITTLNVDVGKDQ